MTLHTHTHVHVHRFIYLWTHLLRTLSSQQTRPHTHFHIVSKNSWNIYLTNLLLGSRAERQADFGRIMWRACGVTFSSCETYIHVTAQNGANEVFIDVLDCQVRFPLAINSFFFHFAKFRSASSKSKCSQYILTAGRIDWTDYVGLQNHNTPLHQRCSLVTGAIHRERERERASKSENVWEREIR